MKRWILPCTRPFRLEAGRYGLRRLHRLVSSASDIMREAHNPVAHRDALCCVCYGIGMHLMPAALLHCTLVPINIRRLVLVAREEPVLRLPVLWWSPVRHPRSETSDRNCHKV